MQIYKAVKISNVYVFVIYWPGNEIIIALSLKSSHCEFIDCFNSNVIALCKMHLGKNASNDYMTYYFFAVISFVQQVILSTQ